MIVRGVVLAVALLPFLRYAARDNRLHLDGSRPVSKAEHLLHLGLGIVIAGVVTAAFLGSATALVAWLAAFVVGGGVDELGFHHGLPAEEHDAHAKEHFTFLGFVVVALALIVADGGAP